MHRILIAAEESKGIIELASGLIQRGLACMIASDEDELVKLTTEQAPDLLLVDIDRYKADSRIWELSPRISQKRHLPIIALANKEMLDSLDTDLNINDFVVEPWSISELAIRIKRTLKQVNNTDMGSSEELIKCGALVIDLAKCEVSLDGRLITLTYREYELLKFLVNNKEHVFSRDALLDKVWGYDYYGGDRTVDVHIRRLRSKIDDPTHRFIETVRNMGYKFKESL